MCTGSYLPGEGIRVALHQGCHKATDQKIVAIHKKPMVRKSPSFITHTQTQKPVTCQRYPPSIVTGYACSPRPSRLCRKGRTLYIFIITSRAVAGNLMAASVHEPPGFAGRARNSHSVPFLVECGRGWPG